MEIEGGGFEAGFEFRVARKDESRVEEEEEEKRKGKSGVADG